MKIKVRLIVLLVWIPCFYAADRNDPSFKIECRHAFNIETLDLAQILPLQKDTKVTISNANTAELLVQSPCCKNISFESPGMVCSRCSDNGIKVCNFTEETITINRIADAKCKSNSKLLYSCTSQNCPVRNNTDNTEVSRPGDDTGCLEGGNRYVCSMYGNWTEVSCQGRVETTTIASTSQTSSGESTETGKHTDTIDTVSPSNTDNSTSSIGILSFPTTTLGNGMTGVTSINSSSSDIPTTSETLNVTGLGTTDKTIRNGSQTNETLTDGFDKDNALKALYTFLIVLAVVLFLVFILVCVFFIRKRKEKVSISHVEYPLEYWHDKDYIDNIVGKNFTTTSSYTLNPVYDNKGHVQRYKKKDQSDYKKRKTTADIGKVGSERARRSNAFRTRSNDSASSGKGNVDLPRPQKQTHTDKYIATAVGSNFYNYNPSQSQDVVKKTTDLDVSMDIEDDEEVHTTRGPAEKPRTTSFKPPRRASEKRSRAKASVAGSARSSAEQWDERVADDDLENIYGANYKEHLRRSLEYWSAEESDA